MKEEIIVKIVFSDVDDLRSLASLAGGKQESFYRGANFSGADLRGEDLRGFNLTSASFRGASIDDTTKVDTKYKRLLHATEINDNSVRNHEYQYSAPTAIFTDAQIRSAITLRNNPIFLKFAKSVVHNIVIWRSKLGSINDLVINAQKLSILEQILLQHFSNPTDNPDDGATFERVLSALSRKNGDVIGRALLRTVLSHGQRSGLLAISQGWYDRRLKLIRPTEKLLIVAGEFISIIFDHIDDIYPDARIQQHFKGATPAKIVGHYVKYVIINSNRVIIDKRIIDIFALDAGHAITMIILDHYFRNKSKISISAVSTELRVSDRQARRILKLAEESGLIRLSTGGVIADASVLADLFVEYFSMFISDFYSKFRPFDQMDGNQLVYTSAEYTP